MNQHAQYGNTYNLNWRNHPNFSWGGNQNIRPQANYNHPPQPPQQVEETLTDMMKKLLIDNQQLRTEFRNLERQFGQMVTIRLLDLLKLSRVILNLILRLKSMRLP